MIVLDDVVYSASDLAVAARREYALLRAFDAQLGRGPRAQADDELGPLSRSRRLARRNEAISQSLYPLRSTLALSMGGARSPQQRVAFLSDVYNIVTEGLPNSGAAEL